MLDSLESTRLTKQVLTTIALHLSGRNNCKGIEYTVTISDAENTITMSPMLTVFPNRYRRHEVDKVNVIYHVILVHFPELFLGIHSDGKTKVDVSQLIPGEYTYQSSICKKRRRWTRCIQVKEPVEHED